MKSISVRACLLGAALALVPPQAQVAAASEPASVEKVIETKGAFAFSDGSSIIQLMKGGRFRLDPVGMSGRSIEGVWRSSESHRQAESPWFMVVGRWSWTNGVSRDDDFRRMKLYVNRRAGPVKRAGMADVEVYPVYFLIEELVPISRAEYERVTGTK